MSTGAQRLTTLSNARELRRQDSILVDTLCNLLVQLDAGQAIDPESLGELAEQILAEAGKTRLRFIYTSPAAVQEYLGGSSFPPPARFIAGQSISAGRVMARIVRHAPEWRPDPARPRNCRAASRRGYVARSGGSIGFKRSTHGIPATIDRSAHARASSEIVAKLLPDFAALVDSIGTHHERLDGTGYPGGLKSDQIPPLARLLAVVDTYTALCCPRPYRPAHDPRTALTDTLLAAEQNLLDRFAAEKLMTLGLYPVGSVVELGDGSVGVVAANHQGRNQIVPCKQAAAESARG